MVEQNIDIISHHFTFHCHTHFTLHLFHIVSYRLHLKMLERTLEQIHFTQRNEKEGYLSRRMKTRAEKMKKKFISCILFLMIFIPCVILGKNCVNMLLRSRYLV